MSPQEASGLIAFLSMGFLFYGKRMQSIPAVVAGVIMLIAAILLMKTHAL